MEAKNLLNVQEIATMLGVPKSWIYQRTRKDAIPHSKLGKYVRFDPVEVLDFVKKKQNKT